MKLAHQKDKCFISIQWKNKSASWSRLMWNGTIACELVGIQGHFGGAMEKAQDIARTK
jgi:hypothetical protein